MPHQAEDDSPGQGGSNASSETPPHQGDDNAPSLSQAKQRKSDGERVSKGGYKAPSSGQPLFVPRSQTVINLQSITRPTGSVEPPVVANSLPFPKCGHVIEGDLLCDFSNSDLTDCPVCEVKSIPSGQGKAAKARSGETARSRDGSTETHSERNRVTLRKYHNPSKWEGATEEIYFSKDGRPRRRVEDSVWNKMTRRQKKQFNYNTNVQFGLPPGEKSQRPTNPGNPNHSDYNPSSTESIVRRSHASRPNPEAMRAAIEDLVASRDQKVAPQKSKSRRSQTVSVSVSPTSFASQANTTSIETTASASQGQEEDLMSFESSETEDTTCNGFGSEAAQADFANSVQSDDLISLGDTETDCIPRNARTRSYLSKEIEEQLSQLDL